MSKKKKLKHIVHDEAIINLIYYVRGHKVMLDRDLAEMYGVETKRLKEAVRRNIERFPEQYMFVMSKEEFKNWRSQIASSNFSDKMGLRHSPFCFTEHGVMMVANVLKSKRAIKMSMRIIDVFIRMREMLSTHKDILFKLEQLEKKLMKQDGRSDKHEAGIQLLFEAIEELREHVQPPNEPRKRIGYKLKAEE